MPTYKLYYFNSAGRAELTRWLFAVAGVDYEDIRLDSEKWQELKPKTPFAQMPCLEVDGVIFGQSNSIARFVAKKTGYAGKTELEEFRANMIVDCVEDVIKGIMPIFFGDSDASKAAAKTKFEEQKDGLLEKFAKFINETGSGYLVGNGLTWADMALVLVLGWVEKAGEVDFVKYPSLKKLMTKVTTEPKIAEWIKKGPATEN